MSKTYKFLQTTPPEKDVKQQTIVASEDVYVKDNTGKYVVKNTDEDKFTIAQLEEDLADIDRQIANLKEQRGEKVAEITEIKTALSIK